jgi:hypothetical protein
VEIYQPNGCIYLKNSFPKWSAGYQTFPAELEGRVRQADILEKRVPGPVLIRAGLKTIGQLLSTDIYKLGNLKDNFETQLQSYVWNRILYSPEERFLAELVFKDRPELRDEPGDLLIDPTREAQRREVVLDLLEDLASQGENKRTAIDLFFGLSDWRPRSNKQIGRIIDRHQKSVIRIKESAFEWLRQSQNTQKIDPFLPNQWRF